MTKKFQQKLKEIPKQLELIRREVKVSQQRLEHLQPEAAETRQRRQMDNKRLKISKGLMDSSKHRSTKPPLQRTKSQTLHSLRRVHRLAKP